MNVYEAHLLSLEQLQQELQSQGDVVKCPVFTWGGQDRRALPGGAKVRENLEAGGFSPDGELAIVCLVGQFASPPEALREAMVNTILTYLGRHYRIREVTIAAGGLQLRLVCTDADQGA